MAAGGLVMTNKDWREGLDAQLRSLFDDDGGVRRRVAITLIEQSVWWLSHATGPVRAPRFADRIEGTPKSWHLKFGANTFHITEAVRACRRVLRDALNCSTASIDRHERRTRLVIEIRKCVSNYQDDYYPQYGNAEQMIFGSHAIDLPDFVDALEIMLKLPTPIVSRPIGPEEEEIDFNQYKRPNTIACPLCNAQVSPKRLVKHQKQRCPNRKK